MTRLDGRGVAWPEVRPGVQRCLVIVGRTFTTNCCLSKLWIRLLGGVRYATSEMSARQQYRALPVSGRRCVRATLRCTVTPLCCRGSQELRILWCEHTQVGARDVHVCLSMERQESG